MAPDSSRCWIGIATAHEEGHLGAALEVPAPARRPRIVRLGVGPAAAREALERAARDGDSPERLLVVGLAGGLDPALAIGDVVEVDRIVNRQGDPLVVGLASDPGTGRTLLASELTVLDPEAKRAARARTGADLVDLESGAAATWARRRGVPCRVVRVIGDAAGDTLPRQVTRWLDPRTGAVRRGRVARDVLRHPGLVRDVRRMNRDSSRALAALRERLAVEMRDLPVNPDDSRRGSRIGDGPATVPIHHD